MKEEAHKVSASTIMSYINAPLMGSFGGTKAIIEKLSLVDITMGSFIFINLLRYPTKSFTNLHGFLTKADCLYRFQT